MLNKDAAKKYCPLGMATNDIVGINPTNPEHSGKYLYPRSCEHENCMAWQTIDEKNGFCVFVALALNLMRDTITISKEYNIAQRLPSGELVYTKKKKEG